MQLASQSFWNIFFTSVGLVLGYVNTVYIFPYFLGVELFGFTRLLIAFGGIFTPLATLGAVQIIFRFKNQFSRALEFSFLLSILGSLLLTGILYFLPAHFWLQKMPDFVIHPVFYFCVFNTFSVFTLLLGADLRMHLKTVFNTFAREFLLRLFQTILVFFYVYFKLPEIYFIPFFIGTFVLHFFVVLLYWFFIDLEAPIENEKKENAVSWHYVGYNFFGNFFKEIINHVDIILLFLYLPEASVFEGIGLYAILKYMATLVLVPQKGIVEMALPMMQLALDQEKINDLQKILQRTTFYQLLFGGAIALLLWINFKDLQVLVPSLEDDMMYIFGFLLLAKLIKVIFETKNSLYILSQYYTVEIYLLAFISFFAFFFGKYMVLEYGVLGAGINHMALVLLLQCGRYFFLTQRLALQWFSFHFLYVFLILGILQFIFHFLPFGFGPWINLLSRTAVFLLFYVFFILLFKIDLFFKNEIFHKN